MVDFADEQQADANYARAMAADAFGFDVDDRNAATTPKEMTALIQAKLRSDIEATAEFAHRQVESPPRKKHRSRKTAEQEAAREKAAEGATRSLREV